MKKTKKRSITRPLKKGIVIKVGKLKKVKQTKRGKKQDDANPHALKPGKRLSKNKNIYYEHRINHAD